jgi:spermidine synthase
LQAQHTKYDAILVDAYRQPYIPFYLATREFFDTVKDHLTPGGTVAINVGHPEQSDRLEKVLSATLRASFGADRVWRDPVDDTNTMVLGTTSSADPAERLREATMPAEAGAVATTTADRLVTGLRGGSVYTDDRAPVEWLVDTSLAQVAH